MYHISFFISKDLDVYYSSQDVRFLVFFTLCPSKALEDAKEPNGVGCLSVAHGGANMLAMDETRQLSELGDRFSFCISCAVNPHEQSLDQIKLRCF